MLRLRRSAQSPARPLHHFTFSPSPAEAGEELGGVWVGAFSSSRTNRMDDGVVLGSASSCASVGRAPRVGWSVGVGEAVIAGTRAGKVLAQVCAGAGMPC